ncbi:hypothetical protein JW921_01140, partial [Candidatus Fermentibacterales bacterium]|nr:hypothetical protein [Candidatus Fermentibacterales bacterium]
MIDLRPLLIAASVILAAVLLRRAFSSWIGGPSRTDEYHRLQTEQRQRDRESGNLPGEDLRCPECGSPMTR